MAIDPVSAVTAGLGVVQAIGGAIGQAKAKKKMEKLQSQRKAYKTPEEIFQILQATQQNAQTGLGAETLAYLTSNNDRNLSTTVGASSLLGGDPNDFGALLDRAMQQTMAIGGQNQAMQMENFSKYLGALNTVADNRAAEWQSQENILKDRIQAISAQGGDATKNLQGGLNNILAGGAGQVMSSLYNQNQEYSDFNREFMNNMTGPLPTNRSGTSLATTGAARTTTNSTSITPRTN